MPLGWDLDVEVVVVGGGMSGLALGVALAGAGVATAVIDREAAQDQRALTFDGRSSAIALGAQRVLATLGVWEAMAPFACPIEDIRVTDGPSRLFLHYDHRALYDGAAGLPFGWIVENRGIRLALQERATGLAGLTWIAPMGLASGDGGLVRDEAGARVTLADGRRLRARLIVAADGVRSEVRARAGIGAREWDYGQTALVTTVAHTAPHGNVAHEHFLPAGPFALLPLRGCETHPHRSSLVWTERRPLVPAILGLDDRAFGAELERRFGDSLGRLAPVGPRHAWPLSLVLAESFVADRVALLADAAHRIHPIAGQGLNLGLRDLAALAEVVVDARRAGLDIGNAAVLARYQRWRRFDTVVMSAVTHGLNHLFSNRVLPIRLARDLGMAAVDRMGPLKRVFMRHAMGLVGDLPRLARGQAL